MLAQVMRVGKLSLPVMVAAAAIQGAAMAKAGDAARPVSAGMDLAGRVRAILDGPGLAGTRWGLVVTTAEGADLLAIAPDERFMPASNTKIFTTAAAFATLPALDAPDPQGGTSVRLLPVRRKRTPDLLLVGSGDAALADRPDCPADCLATLADAVARSGVHAVHDVIGDDSLYPDERWAPGWSWNNLQTRSGTAVSALTVNDNEVGLVIAPGPEIGAAASAQWRPGDAYYTLRNELVTGPAGSNDLHVERLPGSRTVRLYGTVGLGGAPLSERIGIEDPADFAATRFRALLAARGVRVKGQVLVRHRQPAENGAGAAAPAAPVPARSAPEGHEVARLALPPLRDDLNLTSKLSQNLHAELMLRRIARASGGQGAVSEGTAILAGMILRSGATPDGFDFSDGSGMSTYNRVSPRTMTRFLRWTRAQPWGEGWRAILPVGAVDGTLAHRFAGTPLAGRIFAKTGTLSGVNALSGFMTGASGRTLIFSIFANDQPSGAASASRAMDAALLLIAAEN